MQQNNDNQTSVGPLGTVQSLFYSMTDAKRNGATTFFQLVHNWFNTFYQANMNGLERGSNFFGAQDRMNFKYKMAHLEAKNVNRAS